MTPEAQRIAIAKALPDLRGDPLNDLNAMHEVEKTLPQAFSKGQDDYTSYLVGVVAGDIRWSFGPDGELEGNNFDTFTATAAQRAEAFLRTIGKWDDNL